MKRLLEYLAHFLARLNEQDHQRRCDFIDSAPDAYEAAFREAMLYRFDHQDSRVQRDAIAPY